MSTRSVSITTDRVAVGEDEDWISDTVADEMEEQRGGIGTASAKTAYRKWRTSLISSKCAKTAHCSTTGRRQIGDLQRSILA